MSTRKPAPQDWPHEDFVRLCAALRELGAVQVKSGAYEATFTPQPLNLLKPAPVTKPSKPAKPLTEEQRREKARLEREKELERV